jgi:hypothetical protein
VSEGSAVSDSGVVKRALEWIRRRQVGDIDYAQLADRFPMTPEDARRSASALAPLGEPLEVDYVDFRSTVDGITSYRFDARFTSGKVRFDFGLLADGKINQLSFMPLPGEQTPINSLIPDA